MQQVIARLGIDRATFRRWQHLGVAPEPDRYFDGQPLWWWDRVEHWSEQRGRTHRKRFRKPMPVVDLVNIDGIARRLHVTPKVARRWRQQNHLVDPDYRWSFGDVWLWETVQAWSKGDQRRPLSEPVELPEEPAIQDVDDAVDGPVAEGLEELDALVARLDALEVSLNGVMTRTDAVGRSIEEDAFRSSMDRVAAFIDQVDR